MDPQFRVFCGKSNLRQTDRFFSFYLWHSLKFIILLHSKELHYLEYWFDCSNRNPRWLCFTWTDVSFCSGNSVGHSMMWGPGFFYCFSSSPQVWPSSTWSMMVFQLVHTGQWGRGGMPQKLYKSLTELGFLATTNLNGGWLGRHMSSSKLGLHGCKGNGRTDLGIVTCSCHGCTCVLSIALDGPLTGSCMFWPLVLAYFLSLDSHTDPSGKW